MKGDLAHIQSTYLRETHRAFRRRKVDEGKSVSHIESVCGLSLEFLRHLEGKGITDPKKVSQADIDGYFRYLEHRRNHRRPGGLSNAYLDKHREAVFRFMEYVLGVDVGQSPFFVLKYTESGIVPKDILTEEEVGILFEATGPTMDGIRDRAILSALYGCGMRKGELHQLDVGDIDMARATVRIQKSKTSAQRDIPMAPKVLRHIEEYLYGAREPLLPERHSEPAFLLNNGGGRMSLGGIQHKVKQMAKRSGLQKPVTPHRLRHAIATHLLGELALEEIALFLGHRNVDSSQLYTHIKYTNNPKQNMDVWTE